MTTTTEQLADEFIDGDLIGRDVDNILSEDIDEPEQNDPGSDPPDEGGDDPNSGATDENDENKSSSTTTTTTSTDETETKGAESNGIYIVATHWKETGILPEDVEIKPNITDLELLEIYKERADQRAYNERMTTVRERLEMKGLNADEILSDDDLFDDRQFLENYTAIGQLTFQDLSERSKDIQSDLKRLGTEYYMRTSGGKLKEDKVAQLVETDISSNDEETLFNQYRDFFKSEARTIASNIQSIEKERRQQADAKAQADAAYIKQKLESGNIVGRKLTPQEVNKVMEGMFVKNQYYEGPNGKAKGRITLLEKRRLEAENNLDLQLSEAVNRILGIDVKSIEDRSERTGAINMLNNLAKASSVSSSKNVSKNSNANKGVLVLEDEFID